MGVLPARFNPVLITEAQEKCDDALVYLYGSHSGGDMALMAG